jgi:glycosyltransferase involved in cell wall biosynthesis
VSSARNAGLAAATGEYVVFCDGDDRLREIHLEEMLQWITLPGVDLAICGFESVDAAGKPILGRRSEDCSLDSAVQRLDHDLFWKLFREKRIGSCWDKIFRMECIRQHNLQFPVNVPLAEDTDFVLHYLEAAGESCTVAVTDARTYLYLTLEHDSAVQKPRPDQWYFFERLFPMLERHVSEDHHREAFREYLVSAVQFVVDGLLRYDSFLHYHQFRRYIADMLRSCYFREAVHTPNMKEYNRVLTAALKSGSAMAVWCFYLMCKAKFTLRRR